MKKLGRYLAVAAALVFSAGVAQADVITFEEPSTSFLAPNAPLFGSDDVFFQGGFYLNPFSNSAGAARGDLVGALVDGKTLDMCLGVTCPTNNFTTFYTTLNDSVLSIGRTDNKSFKVGSFDASFVGSSDISGLPAVSGYLVLVGIKADNSSARQLFQLHGPAAGELSFYNYATTGAFATGEFKTLLAYGCAFGTSGSCAAFDSNRAQFALDNIQLNSVTAVPEPETWALMLMGLAGVGALSRRQRAAATRHIA